MLTPAIGFQATIKAHSISNLKLSDPINAQSKQTQLIEKEGIE